MPRAFIAHPTDPLTGKRIQITGQTRREIDAKLQRLRTLREEKRLGLITAADLEEKRRAVQGTRVTLRQAVESYVQLDRLARKTRDFARWIVSDLGRLRRGVATKGPLLAVAHERLDTLTPPRLAKHFRALTERLCWATVAQIFSTLNAVARHAAEEGWIVHKPWGMWKPTKPTHPKRAPRREACRNAGERAALVAALSDETCAVITPRGAPSYHLRAFPIVVGLFTGARHGELAGLRWGDVTFSDEDDRATVHIERQWDGDPRKVGDSRVVACAELGAFLRHYFHLAGRPGKRDPLFPSPATGEHHVNNFVDVETLRRAAARAQLGDPKRWSAQSLRDSFITIEAQACGGDLRKFMERTGHRSPDSAWRYLHAYERETPRTSVAAASPALPAPRDP